MAKKVTPRRNGSRNARETLEGGAMASSYARLTPMQVLGPTLMVSRSILVARAGIRARLMSVTYARGLVRLQNSTKTRPIAACCFTRNEKILQHYTKFIIVPAVGSR